MQHHIAMIRKLRKANNLTQQQVADYLHLDRSTYAYYESGRTKINIDILSRLAKFFQISLGQLIGEDPTLTTSATISDGTDAESKAHEAMLINESVARFQQINSDEQYLIILFRSATPEQRSNILTQAAKLSAESK